MNESYPDVLKQAVLAEVAKGRKRMAIARQFGIHSSTITQWIKRNNRDTNKKVAEAKFSVLFNRLPSVENKKFALYLKKQYSEQVATEYCKVILNPQIQNKKHEIKGV
jgi:transposase-like protein